MMRDFLPPGAVPRAGSSGRFISPVRSMRIAPRSERYPGASTSS